MAQPDWAPEGIDMERPSAARIYDYLLGGSHNFAADREYARRLMETMPDITVHAQSNRAFLHRAVRYLVDVGVRQFLDIGSGVPTLGNVHEVAQRGDPDARTVYVDIDPVAVAHSRTLLAGNDKATVIEEDLRNPERILGHPDLRAVLDLDRPVAVLLVAILHVIPDADDPYRIVRVLRDALPAGSHLVIAHGTSDTDVAEVETLRKMSEGIPTPLTLRSRAAIERFFDGYELVDPGLVWASSWRPDFPADADDHPERSSNLVGVGRT